VYTKEADLALDDARFICRKLQRRWLLQFYVLSESRAAVSLPSFLLDFQNHDKSRYIMEKQRKGQGLSKNYTVD